jgi:hypothetical protein
MPLIYRSMLADGNRPRVGSQASTLGVRVAPATKPDIPVDAAGLVHPGTGGMSVAPEWRLLPDHRIPRRLQAKCSRATGNDKFHCWRMGEGPFLPEPVSPELALRPDRGALVTHGVVEPIREMGLAEFQAALEATSEQWVIDEA